jgi:hypothetical protein
MKHPAISPWINKGQSIDGERLSFGIVFLNKEIEIKAM